MDERPIRLRIFDDLRRGHGSVFFRAWLVVPFLLWLGLWTIIAFLVAIANWAATLVRGRSPEPLHRFLVRFVRYTTHVFAYYNLAAEPLPAFDGKPGYQIDLEVDPPVRQNRASVAFRIILAVPALLLSTVLVGGGIGIYDYTSANFNGSGGVMFTAALLGWFVAVILGRMPRGLRDLIAYAISYGAQFWAYLLLLTERYPSSDPLTAIGPLPVCEHPLRVEVRDDLRRSRLTVFFRLLLAAPHYIWLALWGIAALVAAVANWFATLATGNSPKPLHDFLATYLRYQLNVSAYFYLIGNPFPGFMGEEGRYPIDLHVAEPTSQNRWGVFFRLPLALPALLLASVYGGLLLVAALLGWFASLFTARMPLGLRNAGALALRYTTQTYGYLFIVTGAYPYSGPCDSPSPAVAVPQASAPVSPPA